MKSQIMRTVLALLAAWNAIFYVDHGNGINLGMAVFAGIIAVMPSMKNDDDDKDEEYGA